MIGGNFVNCSYTIIIVQKLDVGLNNETTKVTMKINLLIVLFIVMSSAILAQRNNITYDSLDRKPYYKDGEKEFKNFLAENIQYPESAMENGIDGTVVISFQIDVDGTISNIQFKNNVDNSLNKEAERLFRLTNGNWIPGVKDGELVQSYYEEVIKFKLVGQKDPSHYMKKAKRKFNKEKYEDAIPLLEKFISYEPYNFEFLEKLAKAYHELERFDKSCAIVKRLHFLKYESLDTELVNSCNN